MWNTIVIFAFYVQKLFVWLRKCTVEPLVRNYSHFSYTLMLYELFYRSLFWTLEHFSCVAVYGGYESSQIQTKTP